MGLELRQKFVSDESTRLVKEVFQRRRTQAALFGGLESCIKLSTSKIVLTQLWIFIDGCFN